MNTCHRRSSRAHRGARCGAGASLALTAFALLSMGAASVTQDTPAKAAGPDVEGARQALDQWVQARKVISAERRDWELGREMLTDRIDLVGQEIETLRARIDEAQTSIAEADRKREELVEKNTRLQAASASLVEVVAGLEARTWALLARLPDPLRERVKPLSQRLPDDPETTDQTLSERFQNVVGILNEVNKFDREITLTSEVRTLADGTTAEVAAFYVGLGQAYYATGDGRAAGVGAPSGQGWDWIGADDSAARIARAIAILKNEDVAAFIGVPIQMP